MALVKTLVAFPCLFSSLTLYVGARDMFTEVIGSLVSLCFLAVILGLGACSILYARYIYSTHNPQYT